LYKLLQYGGVVDYRFQTSMQNVEGI